MPRLEKWSTGYWYSDDHYRPPENNPLVLRGAVFGHASKPDGMRVKTSPIVEVNGKTVKTESGSTYELGEPDSEWLKWLATNKIEFRPENPITLKVRSR